jgi:hypothetical protein
VRDKKPVYYCGSDTCSFREHDFSREDWSALRYIKPEAAPKPRRMKGCGKKDGDLNCNVFCIHRREHDEIENCSAPEPWCPGPCQPVEAEQPAVPPFCTKCGKSVWRTVNGVCVDCAFPGLAIPATSRTCPKCGKTTNYPANEVDFICECERRTLPDHIADAGKMVAPDPGEGWRWLDKWDALAYGDQFILDSGGWGDVTSPYFGDPILPDMRHMYRRRVEPEKQEKGFVDWPIYLSNDGQARLFSIDEFVRGPHLHTLAPSLRGFMGFVYDAGDDAHCGRMSHLPCLWGNGSVVFPVAVRFEK